MCFGGVLLLFLVLGLLKLSPLVLLVWKCVSKFFIDDFLPAVSLFSPFEFSIIQMLDSMVFFSIFVSLSLLSFLDFSYQTYNEISANIFWIPKFSFCWRLSAHQYLHIFYSRWQISRFLTLGKVGGGLANAQHSQCS